MNTKQFEFPTFAQWATESYRRMVDKDLFGPTPGMGRIEENIAERFFKEWRRFYALDFLTSLMGFVGTGEESGVAPELKPRHFPNLKMWGIGYDRDESPTSLLFKFSTLTQIQAFLYYEGCGTTTKEQLNILYNIDQN